MMFLASAAVLAATAFAQNPLDVLPIECPVSTEACTKKLGYSTMRDAYDSVIVDTDYFTVFRPIVKCLLKGKGGELADEVNANTGYPCAELVPYIDKLLNPPAELENDDPKCEKACADTLEFCGRDLNLLSMTSDEYAGYMKCRLAEGVKEAGCCECEANCPAMPMDEAKDICNDASESETACSNALKPHYGLCSYHKNNKMKNPNRMCKLHTFWKGNCGSLNRRLCKIAVEAKACSPVQKAGKKKYKKCAELGTEFR